MIAGIKIIPPRVRTSVKVKTRYKNQDTYYLRHSYPLVILNVVFAASAVVLSQFIKD